MNEHTVRVIVAAHKPYEMPNDRMYLPVHVGAAGKESIGFQRDDEGDNISNLNPYFCELTGLYWAWKNLPDEYIGLVHYRRLFTMKGHTLTSVDIKPYLGKVRLFTPRKRRYYIETLKSHYCHTHYLAHLEVTRDVVKKLYPEYIKAYETAINRRWGYMFNMMIMERELINDYCTWLFSILSEVYKQVDTSAYPDFAKRYIGRLSEILFNVWIEKKLDDGSLKKQEIKELNCNVEENWGVKIPAFLKAKFFGIKYEKSF